MDEWICDWIAGWMNKSVSEWMNEFVNRRINEWIIELIYCKWMNEPMNEGIIGMNEWWTNGYMNK